MSTQKPTRGQIERTLKQRIQALYLAELGQRPEQVICQFFDDKLAIVLEKSVTLSEKFLLATQRQELAQEVRSHIDAAIKPKLIQMIEEVTGVAVNTILTATDLNSSISGIIVILSGLPSVRDLESIPKAKRKKKCLKSEKL